MASISLGGIIHAFVFWCKLHGRNGWNGGQRPVRARFGLLAIICFGSDEPGDCAFPRFSGYFRDIARYYALLRLLCAILPGA